MHASVHCIDLMFCLKYQWPWCPTYWPRCPLIIFKSQGQLALPSNCPNSRPAMLWSVFVNSHLKNKISSVTYQPHSGMAVSAAFVADICSWKISASLLIPVVVTVYCTQTEITYKTNAITCLAPPLARWRLVNYKMENTKADMPPGTDCPYPIRIFAVFEMIRLYHVVIRI